MTYCERCDRYFPHNSALAQHKSDSSRHNICYDCRFDFPTFIGLKEHWVQSPRHHYCQRCSEHFEDEDDLDQHYRDYHYYCGPCAKFFKDDLGLHEHRRQSSAHHYCAPCKRLFQSAANLNAVSPPLFLISSHIMTDSVFPQHLNSSIHLPKTVPCHWCNRSFISGPNLVGHLESGTCSPGMTRHDLQEFVRSCDTSNVITNPARMIGNTTTTYQASEAAWSYRAQAYECYLCHKLFAMLPSLNKHLGSPAHEEKVYICPLQSCRGQFATLGGLWNHIESEKCGVKRFTAVKNAIDGIMGKMKQLTF